VSLIRLENQVQVTGDRTHALSVSNAEVATPNGGDHSVAPPQNSGNGRQQDHPRHCDTDGDADAGADGHQTKHKFEFLKFDSIGDPLPWLNHVDDQIWQV
jgi:hypothetical protein